MGENVSECCAYWTAISKPGIQHILNPCWSGKMIILVFIKRAHKLVYLHLKAYTHDRAFIHRICSFACLPSQCRATHALQRFDTDCPLNLNINAHRYMPIDLILLSLSWLKKLQRGATLADSQCATVPLHKNSETSAGGLRSCLSCSLL